MILRKIRSLTRVGRGRQALVAEAAANMLAARVMLLIRPFAKVSRRFGAFVPPGDPRVTGLPPASAADAHIAREIRWAIAASAPFMPFRSVCLQQAMAGHFMLRRRGVHSVLHFGARRAGGNKLDAHAWLDAGGVKVTGYPIEPTIAELGCFV